MNVRGLSAGFPGRFVAAEAAEESPAATLGLVSSWASSGGRNAGSGRNVLIQETAIRAQTNRRIVPHRPLRIEPAANFDLRMSAFPDMPVATDVAPQEVVPQNACRHSGFALPAEPQPLHLHP